METLQITLYANPFPLMVVDNFYNEEELNLIWEEQNILPQVGVGLLVNNKLWKL